MSVFPTHARERLIELLNEEKALTEGFLSATLEQQTLLEADDIEGFDRSLDKRQEIIQKIDGLHQESNALMQSYISFSGGADAEIDGLRGRIRELLEKARALNEKNAASAKKKSTEYSGEIKKIGMEKKSVGIYNQGARDLYAHFDKKM